MRAVFLTVTSDHKYRPLSLFQFISKCIKLEDIWCKDHLWKMTMTLISSKAHTLHCTALSALAATKGRESVCKSVLSLHSLLFWHFLPQKIHKMSVNFFPRWINLNFIYLWFHLCWNYSALRKIKIIELMLANHWIQRSYV